MKRDDFPPLERMVYLNTAAEGIPPNAVASALTEYAKDKLLGMDGRVRHAVWRDKAKSLAADAYSLAADEIGICSCTSEAFILLSLALKLKRGDEVIVSDLDFPAAVTPWLQPGCPATVKVWRSREGRLAADDLAELLTPRTRLVAFSLVSFYNGFRAQLGPVLETVRKRSESLVALDVTQALGRIPLDVSGVDFVVSSTHKWILASHGGGIVGIPSSRATELTAHAGGWFSIENAFAEDRFERAPTQSGATSYSVGMPNYPAVYAIKAGLEYVQAVGIAEIDAYCRPLVRACIEGMRALPVELITPVEDEHLAGIVAFRHPKAEAINRMLHDEDIHIMGQAGRLRVSVHGYNTAEDIDRFLEALSHALSSV